MKREQFKNPYRTVIDNSIIKAKNVYNYIKEHSLKKQDLYYGKEFLIAGFDTIIYMNKRYLGKPASIGAGNWIFKYFFRQGSYGNKRSLCFR